MDFSLTDQQMQMQAETGRSLERLFPLNRIREAERESEGLRAGIWADIAALGLPGLLVEAQYGGLGCGVLDAVVVAEQLGRYIVPTPFVAAAVMAPLAIQLAGSEAQRASLLPQIASGDLIIGVGISDFASGARGDEKLVLHQSRLFGSSIFVLDADAAMFLLADAAQNLHLVQRGAPGLSITKLETVDGTRRVCKLDFSDVPCETLENQPGDALVRICEAGRIVLAADTLGAAWRMLEQAVEYAGQRRQFGRLIGSFQAVKHICAEIAAELEPARALIWYAAYAQDTRLDDAAITSLHAKAYVCDAGRMVARKATEVHGGIGITDELGLHFWFKRIGWNYQILGAPERLREAAARFQGLVS